MLQNLLKNNPINLQRFRNHFAVDFVDVDGSETIRSFDFSESEIENGVMKEVLHENIHEFINKCAIVETEYSSECNVYVNGLMVYDLEKELGLDFCMS